MNEVWDERQDIVDEDDNVISSDTRDNIWKNGNESQTRAVNLFVIDENNNILIPVRSRYKKKWPLCYDFSCGENVQSGESYEDAIKRGISEELGVVDLLPVEISYITPKDGANCFLKNYRVNIVRDLFNFKSDPNEVDHFEWKTVNEIKELLSVSTDNFKRGYKEVFDKSFS